MISYIYLGRRTADYVHAVSQDTHLAEKFDFNTPPKTFMDVLYEGTPNHVEEFSKANSVAHEPQSWSSKTSNTLPLDDAVKQDHQDVPYIDDDALSTITEATEPDAPSLYSFRSSSSSTSTKVSDEKNEHGTIQRTDKNINGNINVFHQHQAVLASVSPNTTLTNDTASHTAPSVLNCDMDTRGSYTVNRGTVEAAVATGLPIITDSVKRSLYQPLTRMDATSAMEVTNRQEYDETSEIPIRYETSGVSSAGNNSDFEDAPIHIASGSSSGLSTDDGIGHAVSDTDESTRPSNVIYSSLSEHMSPLSPNVHARLEPFAGYDELRDLDGNEETLVESVKTSFVVDNETLHSSVAELESIPMTKKDDPESRTRRVLKDFSNTSRKIDIQVSYKHWPFTTTKNSAEQTKIKFPNNLLSTAAPITWFDLVQNNVNKNESKLKEMFEQVSTNLKKISESNYSQNCQTRHVSFCLL